MTKPVIYEQFDKAFSQVGAHAVTLNGKHVANITFKFPRDGASRLNAFVHWHGIEMVKGSAGGYGYDKQSAAVESAIQNICKKETPGESWPFTLALSNIGGSTWRNALQDAGFQVISVI